MMMIFPQVGRGNNAYKSWFHLSVRSLYPSSLIMNKSLAAMNGVGVFSNTSFVHFLGDFYLFPGVRFPLLEGRLLKDSLSSVLKLLPPLRVTDVLSFVHLKFDSALTSLLLLSSLEKEWTWHLFLQLIHSLLLPWPSCSEPFAGTGYIGVYQQFLLTLT